MNARTLPFDLSPSARLLALPPVTLQTVRQPGLDATIIRRNGFRELHVTVRPSLAERPLLWSWRLKSFLREHCAIIVKQDIFGSLAGCREAVARMAGLWSKLPWPLTCVAGAPCPVGDIAGTQVLAVSGAPVKPILAEGRVTGSVFNDGWARHCLLGDIHPRNSVTHRSSQAAQTYSGMEDGLARAGFALPNLVRTWLFIDNILSWYKEFNEVRTEIFTQRDLFSHLVPASTGVGAMNPYGAALLAGAWAMQPLDGSGLTITEVKSPLQCSARKYGSCFSRAVAVTGSGLERLFVSGTASIEPGGRSAHAGDVRRQIQLTMEVVGAILRSRGMRWTDVSRATVYFKHPADAPRFSEWCATHDIRLPALVAQADICRDELLFEIEVDALAVTPEEL